MIQFYAPGLPDDPVLDEVESAHCLRVLRMQPGDRLVCVDGRGTRYDCILAATAGKRAVLEVTAASEVLCPWCAPLTVAVAPTKHLDRMEWLVEKLVESGVDRIVPMLCERSERREIKTERLVKIAVSAMKQSLKATLPAIEPMTRLRDVVDTWAGGVTDCFVACCDQSIPRRDFVTAYRPGRPTLVMIGPEGDFSPAEIEYALSRGTVPASFGEVRLRTETAALYAVMAAHAVNTREGHTY